MNKRQAKKKYKLHRNLACMLSRIIENKPDRNNFRYWNVVMFATRILCRDRAACVWLCKHEPDIASRIGNEYEYICNKLPDKDIDLEFCNYLRKKYGITGEIDK